MGNKFENKNLTSTRKKSQNPGFSNISQAECLIASKKTIDNSFTKQSSAKIVAQNGDYGTAITLLIVSNEEMIKALILTFEGEGFEFRKIKGVENLFSNHKLRYLLAMIISLTNLFLKDFQRFLIMLFENENLLEIFKKEGVPGLINLIKGQIKFYYLRKVILLKQDIALFSTIDKNRQQGLYSDYENKFISPLDKSQKDFEIFQERIITINQSVSSLIDSFNSPSPIISNSIENLKQQFKSEGWYKKIGETIVKVNDNNYDSYKELHKLITDFHNDTKGHSLDDLDKWE